MDMNAVGQAFPPYEFLVERGKIREFAEALEDPNPIYRDPKYAAETHFGKILAPPTFVRTFLYESRDAVDALLVSDWSYIVHGEQQFEYFGPVFAGDVLTGQDRISEMYQKKSRRAGMLNFAGIESTFHNQLKEKVIVARRTLIETGVRIEETSSKKDLEP